MSRKEAAREALNALMALSDEDERILCGPDVSTDEIGEAVHVDRAMATQAHYFSGDLLEAVCGEKRRPDETGVDEAFRRVVSRVLTQGLAVHARPDDVRFYQAPGHDGMGVAAQVAIDHASEPPQFAGAYLGSSLYVAPGMRGRGIGSTLSWSRSWRRASCTSGGMTPSFSPEGGGPPLGDRQAQTARRPRQRARALIRRPPPPGSPRPGHRRPHGRDGCGNAVRAPSRHPRRR